MPFGTIIDEGRLEAGFDTGYFTLVNIGLFLLSRRYFDIEVVESLPIDHGHSQLFRLGGVD